jgi:predicted RND superfamily exporter protein
MENYSNFIQRFRYLVILLTLGITAVMLNGTGILFSKPDNDYRSFFGDNNPELMAFEFIQDNFAKSDNALFVIAPKEGDVFNNNTLEAIQWVTEEAWLLNDSTRVDSIANYQHTQAEEDNLIVAELFEDTSSLDDAQRQEIADIVLNEQLLVKRLIAEDGNAAGVNVTFTIADDADQTVVFKDIANQIYDVRSRFYEKYPDHDMYLTGIVMMNQAFGEAGEKDAQTLMPIMYLVVLIILAVILRSAVPVISTMLIIFFSIFWAYGFAGYIGIKLTTPMFSIMNIVLTLAVADCVHLLMTFVQGMRNGDDKVTAIKESIRINAWPIFLTSITTAIGFLTLNFSETPPFQDLGNTAAFGVMAAWAMSMTFLPAMIFALPVKIKPTESKESSAMANFAEFVIAKQKAILWTFIPISAALVYGVTQIELNDDYVKYFDKRIEFRNDTDAAYDKLTGINNIQYSLSAKESNGITDPEYLRVLEEFVEWHRQQPLVMNVDSINDVFKRLNKNMHGDDESWFRVPDNKELAAQYLLLYELSLPYGLDLNNQIDVDKAATRVTITTQNATNNEMLALADAGKKWLEENAPEYMQTVGASPTIMFANVGKRNINTMLFGTIIALFLISLILIFALRSVKIGVLSLVPNLLPIGLTFGIWGYLVGQVGLASSIVAAICMGIVVDDSVHFLSKYLRARREKGLSAEDSIRYAFSTVGIALWVTSLVLVLGFLVLAYSAFLINSQLGQLTFLTISLALITDFLLLPPLLIWLDKNKQETPNTQASSA